MTPCLEALHSFSPSIEIAVVTEPLAVPILEGHPLISNLIVAGPNTLSRLKAITRIRRWKPDVAFNLHGGTTGMLMAAMSKAYYSAGYGSQRGSALLSTPAPDPEIILGREKIHSVEQQLALLYWTGVPWIQKPDLDVPRAFDAAARIRGKLISIGVEPSLLQSRRIACIAPGAAFESKRWHAEGFSAVVSHLADRWALESVILAGPGQESLAQEVGLRSGRRPFVLTGLDLKELVVLLSANVCLFVGNDSGPMHIAAAVRCPVVAVFGSSNPDVWHPWTDSAYRVIGGERGTPDSNSRDSIDRVETSSVISAVDAVLSETQAVRS
jgi:ADP-heptose:LPS heptosyltransferase